MRPFQAFSLVLVLSFSACLSSTGGGSGKEASIQQVYDGTLGFAPFTVPDPGFDFHAIVDPDHGVHSDHLLHTAGKGLDLVGHTGVQDILPPGMTGSITQVDVWKDYAVVAGFYEGPAFIIIDIKDPAHPKPLSYMPTVAWGWSARFTDDGEYLFFACQVIQFQPQNGYLPQGYVKGDCEDPDRVTGATSAPPGGVSIYDVHDKSNPKFVDWVPTKAAHNLQVANIDGVDYAFTNYVDIVKFNRGNQTLERIAEVPGRHDATVVRHPVTGDWLLYSGARPEGFAVYDVNDPANPDVVLEPGEFTQAVGWHEQVAFPTLVAGHALIALAGETGTPPRPEPLPSEFPMGTGVPDVVSIVDITNPLQPVLLGDWTPPFADAQIPWDQYTWSVHEMAATPQGQLAISWYHGGVWVIDVSTPERMEHPVTVAAYQPHEAINVVPGEFRQTPVPMVPFTWGAGWDARGYLVVPDMHTGLYVLQPEWGLLPLIDSGT